MIKSAGKWCRRQITEAKSLGHGEQVEEEKEEEERINSRSMYWGRKGRGEREGGVGGGGWYPVILRKVKDRPYCPAAGQPAIQSTFFRSPGAMFLPPIWFLRDLIAVTSAPPPHVTTDGWMCAEGPSRANYITFGAARYDVHKIFGFLSPPPSPPFGSDL